MSSPDPFGDALARSRANAPPDPSDQDPFGTALSDAAGGRSFTTEETDYPREGFVAYADPKTGKVTYRRPKSDQVASAAAQRRDLAGSADVVATLAGGIVSGTVGGAGDILERAAGNNRGTIKGWIQRHATYTPQTPEGQQAFRELAATRPVQAVHKGLQALDTALGKIGPRTQQFGRDVGNIAGDVLSVAPAAGMLRSVGTAAKVGEVAAEAAPEAAASMEVPGTLSAARATTDLGGTTPELQAAVSDAKTAGKPINQEALDRHVEAETLPMPDGETPLRLRKGQATANEQQISDEKNLRADPDTQGILTDSISEQNRKLGASMGEIRRRATPEIVQRNNLVLDTRAKYKALTDANGGVVPLDTGMAAANIDAQLAKGYLTKVAASDPAISEIMEALRSGKPISFEQFENARTGLAEVQRGRGSAGTAAGIVRKELESMPLTPEAQGLKGLA